MARRKEEGQNIFGGNRPVEDAKPQRVVHLTERQVYPSGKKAGELGIGGDAAHRPLPLGEIARVALGRLFRRRK